MAGAGILERGNRPFTLNLVTAEDTALYLAVFGVAAIGVLVLAARPRHRSWRLLLAFGVLFAAAMLAHAVAVRTLLVGQGPQLLGWAAAWLGLSAKTVRNQVSTVLSKLRVSDRTAAGQRAREAGIL